MRVIEENEKVFNLFEFVFICWSEEKLYIVCEFDYNGVVNWLELKGSWLLVVVFWFNCLINRVKNFKVV